jgi:hypothetical protein
VAVESKLAKVSVPIRNKQRRREENLVQAVLVAAFLGGITAMAVVGWKREESNGS